MDINEAHELLQVAESLAQNASLEDIEALRQSEAATLQEIADTFRREGVAFPVGSILLASMEFKGAKEGLTDEADAVIWARDTYDAFRQQAVTLTGKKRTNATREFVRDSLRMMVDQKDIVGHPELFLTAYDTWHAMALNGGAREQEFLDAVTEQALRKIHDTWRRYDGETIAGYVRGASSERLSAGFSQHMLAGYFDGPRSADETVDAYYELADCLLDVYDDPKAFGMAAKIMNFATPMIRLGSQFQLRISQAEIGNVHNPDVLCRVLLTKHIASSAAEIADVLTDIPDVRTRHEAIAPRLGAFISQRTTQVKEAGDEESLKRMIEYSLYLLDVGDSTIRHFGYEKDVADAEQGIPEWLRDALYGSTDPLFEKFKDILGNRISSLQIKKLIESDTSVGYKVARTAQLVLPNSSVVDVYLPKGLLLHQERELLNGILKSAKADSQEFLDQKSELEVAEKYSMSLPKTFHMGGQKVHYSVRPASRMDNVSIHEVNELMWTALPYAESIDDDRLVHAVVEVQDNIEAYQHRFLNRRGIRINFDTASRLGSVGFSHVVFREAVTDSRKIETALTHDRATYRYKLDGNFGLDLDGKKISSGRFQQELHYMTLLLLRDYVCGVVLDTEEGELNATATGPAARIDYLRYLPNGQHFRPQASKYYLERRGKDLLTKSEERKRVDPKGRNSTYVREVEQTDSMLPPLVVHINPDDFLYPNIVKKGFKLPESM